MGIQSGIYKVPKCDGHVIFIDIFDNTSDEGWY